MKVVSQFEYDFHQERRHSIMWMRDDIRNMLKTGEFRDVFERVEFAADARHYDREFKEQSYNLKNAVMVGDNE